MINNFISKPFIDAASGLTLFDFRISLRWYYAEGDELKSSEERRFEDHEDFILKSWVIESFPVPIKILNDIVPLEGKLNQSSNINELGEERFGEAVSIEKAEIILADAFEKFEKYKDKWEFFSYPPPIQNGMFLNHLEDFRADFRLNFPALNFLTFNINNSFDFFQKQLAFTLGLHNIWGKDFATSLLDQHRVNESNLINELGKFSNGRHYFDFITEPEKHSFYRIQLEEEEEEDIDATAWLIVDEHQQWVGFGYYIPEEMLEEYNQIIKEEEEAYNGY